MAEPVVVVGAGGHAKVVIELLRASGFDPVALVDTNPRPRDVLGVPVVGDDTALPRLRAEGLSAAFPALGDNRARLRIGQTLRDLHFQLVNAISPAATISPSARLGEGVAVMASACVNAEAELHDLSILNTGATLDHDGVLSIGAHAGPGCALAGSVWIGPGALLGAGVCAIPGASVGEGTLVGAGATIVRDLPPFALAYGTPARVVWRRDQAAEGGRR